MSTMFLLIMQSCINVYFYSLFYSEPGLSILGLYSVTFLTCRSECVDRMSHHNADCNKRVPVMEKYLDRFLKLDTSPSPPRFNYMSEKPQSLSVAVQTLLFKESSYRGAKKFWLNEGLIHEGNGSYTSRLNPWVQNEKCYFELSAA